MEVFFAKYHASGNDFIIIDNRNGNYNYFSDSIITTLCDRKYGIGADGLIFINTHEVEKFYIDYRNADGSKSLCGNGSLCAVNYITSRLKEKCNSFLAFDGKHFVVENKTQYGISMRDVKYIKQIDADFEIDTGSPHYIHFTNQISTFELIKYAKNIRFSEKYKKNGINVNIVEKINDNKLFIRTYERGVEDETLSCGTGATASALAYTYEQQKIGFSNIQIKTIGHKNTEHSIYITFNYDGIIFSDIKFYNHPEFVFKGNIFLPT